MKGLPGRQDDNAIKKIAKYLGCKLALLAIVKKAAYVRNDKDESTTLAYRARKRNDIAHGVSTFENGANDLTLDDLELLANRVLPFLRAVPELNKAFPDNNRNLSEEGKS